MNALSKVLLSDVIALRIAVAVGAYCMAFGMYAYDTPSPDYDMMLKLMAPWQWAVCFFGYGTGKLALAFAPASTIHRSVAWPVIIAGLFLWIYTFLSFTAFDYTAAETMMLSIVFCEIWIGAHTIAGVIHHGA